MKYLVEGVKTILIFGFLLSSNSIIGQKLIPFPQKGLVQGEVYWGGGTPTSFEYYNLSFKYVKDTIFDSKTFSQFVILRLGIENSFYTRYDNGKIYYHNGTGGTEFLLYDFTLQLKDTFPSDKLNNPIVDSISTVTLPNGQIRKYMELKNEYNTHRWIDGIGDIDFGLLYNWGGREGERQFFVCQKDEAGIVYENMATPWSCDSLTNVTLVTSLNSKSNVEYLEVFPNPTQGILTIKGKSLDENTEVQLMDLSGRFILAKKIESKESIRIDLSEIKDGAYLLMIFRDNETQFRRIIKD